jgi:hypothetical protein
MRHGGIELSTTPLATLENTRVFKILGAILGSIFLAFFHEFIDTRSECFI